MAAGLKDAAEYASETEVILGVITERQFSDFAKLKWVHATASGVDMFMFDDFINSDVVPVSYTHLTLPTTPYV